MLLGLRFMPCPGLSCSGDQVFGERGHSYLSPLLFLLLGFLSVQPAHLLRRVLTIQNLIKSRLAVNTACSLVDDASLKLQLPPSSSGCPRSPVPGRGWAGLQILPTPLFCEQAWWCLSLGLFTGVAIPGSGLLSHVSSLRLPSGHASPVLTLSSAARTSLPSPHLLVVDAGICAASLLGVTFGHVTCRFKLFIYLSSQLYCHRGSKACHRLTNESVSWCLDASVILKLPSWDASPSLPFLSLFLSFTFFSTSFRRRAAFLGA